MKSFKSGILVKLFLIVALLGVTNTLDAQNAPEELREEYLTPPDEISEEVLAPRYKNYTLTNLGPGRNFFLHYIENAGKGLAPITGYAKHSYNLGGLQIDPKANRQRIFTTQMPGYAGLKMGDGLELIDALTGEKHEIQTPEEAHLSDAKWSPDKKKIAYLAHFDNGTHIYVANLKSGQSRRITKQPVLATLNTSFDWSADGQFIFTVLVPLTRGEVPQKTQTDLPQVRMTTPEKNKVRTFKDLLEGSYEAKLLEYYITGQFARIDIDDMQVHKIGEPAMIRSINTAPNGKYSIVETLQKPFSYIVPVSSFAWNKEIWDSDGNVVTMLQKSEPSMGIPDYEEEKDFGRSDIKWRPDGKGLSLVARPIDDEEENNKDENSTDLENKKKDEKQKIYRVIHWPAPFGKNDQKTLYESKDSIKSVSYAENSEVFFVSEEPSEHKENLYAVYPDSTYAVYRYDEEDFYSNPGNLMHKTGAKGLPVVQMTPNKENVFLSGTQYYKNPQENAPQPFIDRFDVLSGIKERIFQSSKDFYENIAAMLDDEANKIVVSRQSSDTYPDSWLININSGEKTKLTSNTDYNEAISHARRERFKVKRADGFEFWVEAILPRNWNGEALPGLIWHYPREYDDQEDYNESKRDYNKSIFPQIVHGWPERSPEILIKRGYAILKADWPIVAEGGGSNDGFVWSIQQNCTVVIDSAVSKGYVDRNRMGIGGHSYGAFGTANAMIHTSFFKAGIAGDGAYNRTLTPFGFQSEPRDLWHGLSRYLEMSPIFWADQLDGALLMYHGAADQNSGTWPTNSWRMFQALNALGKPASMYMYPYAAHHTGAKEIILDRWTRWANWLDHYLKEQGKPVPEYNLGK